MDTALTNTPVFPLLSGSVTLKALLQPASPAQKRNTGLFSCTYSIPATGAKETCVQQPPWGRAHLLFALHHSAKAEFIKQQLFMRFPVTLVAGHKTSKKTRYLQLNSCFFLFFFPHTSTTTLSKWVPMSTPKAELYLLPAAAASLTASLLLLLALFWLIIIFPVFSSFHCFLRCGTFAFSHITLSFIFALFSHPHNN